MDSNEPDDTNEVKPTSAPVMDVQPPRPAQDVVDPAVSSEDSTPASPVTDDMPSIADETGLGVEPQQDASVPVAPPAPEAPAPTDNKPNLSMPELPAHAKKKSPMLAILIVIVLALGLAGGAVYLYMKTKDSTKNTQTTNTTNTSNATETPITQADVDNTVKEVDDAVNSLDDTKDLNENDLSDATLGL